MKNYIILSPDKTQFIGNMQITEEFAPVILQSLGMYLLIEMQEFEYYNFKTQQVSRIAQEEIDRVLAERERLRLEQEASNVHTTI